MGTFENDQFYNVVQNVLMRPLGKNESDITKHNKLIRSVAKVVEDELQANKFVRQVDQLKRSLQLSKHRDTERKNFLKRNIDQTENYLGYDMSR